MSVHLCFLDVHVASNYDIPVKQVSSFESKDFPFCGIQRKLTVTTVSSTQHTFLG